MNARVVGAVTVVFATLVACGEVASSPPPPPVTNPGVTEEPPTVGGDDAAVPDVAPKTSPCPPPGKIAPADVPAGYLPPAKVKLRLAMDGDTALFDFPNTTEKRSVRFLYVNAEETGGTYKTAFGVETSTIIGSYLKSASEIVIALEESKTTPGTAALDEFDRWLGLIFLDGDLLQTRMVREGLSPYFTSFGCAKPPLHDALFHAEAEANTAKRGLWTPTHPTDYKKYTKLWLGSSGCRPNPFETPYCQ